MPNGIGYNLEIRGGTRPDVTTRTPMFILEDTVTDIASINANQTQRLMRVDRGMKILALQILNAGGVA